MAITETSPTTFFGSLPIARYRFDIRLDRPVNGFMGSAWRGLIGWELKRLLCPFAHKPGCKTCLIREHCPYFQLFEDQSMFSGFQEKPRAYIVSPAECDPNGKQKLDITLIGRCIRSFPAVARAIESGGSMGLGPSRINYHIQGMEWVLPGGKRSPISLDECDGIGLHAAASLSDWLQAEPEVPDPVSFQFQTPVRLKIKGKYQGRMEWTDFFATLVRRLEALSLLFYEGEPLGKDGYMNLMHGFQQIDPLPNDLRWVEYSRYSNRQRKKVPMGGLIGNARLNGSDSWLLPWLLTAELVHVGKGTSMGLGKISILRNGSRRSV